MKRFEYDISLHPASEFKQVAVFCSAEGACNVEEVPADQVRHLQGILSERGAQGWELVHLAFGNHGVMAFWKRETA